MVAVLLSIQPRFAEAILEGTKTYELRRRFPQIEEGTTFYLYSTSPRMAIVGSFISGEIKRSEKTALWFALKSKLGLAEKEFDDYLYDRMHGVGIRATRVVRFRRAISLAQIRSHMKLEAPQSFRYVPADAERWLLSQIETHPENGQQSRSIAILPDVGDVLRIDISRDVLAEARM